MAARELSDEPNARKARLGESEAKIILEKQGFQNVKKREKGETGFDLKAEKDGNTVRIEVKSTVSPNEIPDAYENEFDFAIVDDPKLKAEFLLVMRLVKDNAEPTGFRVYGAHLLPKDFVDGYKHYVKKTVVLSDELKGFLKNAPQYWVDY